MQQWKPWGGEITPSLGIKDEEYFKSMWCLPVGQEKRKDVQGRIRVEVRATYLLAGPGQSQFMSVVLT